MSNTPLIDSIIAKAAELWRSEEFYPDYDGNIAIDASMALSTVLEREIQTDEQARQLFNEMVDADGTVNVGMLDSCDTLAKLIRNLACASNEVFTDKVEAAIPDYDARMAARSTKYDG